MKSFLVVELEKGSMEALVSARSSAVEGGSMEVPVGWSFGFIRETDPVADDEYVLVVVVDCVVLAAERTRNIVFFFQLKMITYMSN